MSTRAPIRQLHRSDPAGRREIAALSIAAALAFALMHLAFHGRADRFDELALGEETTALFAELDGERIHCQGLGDAPDCLGGHARRGGQPVVLWLGNSQVHAVNQLHPGEENAPPILARRLRQRGLDLLTFSQPNANLQEHLVLYAYLSARLPLRSLILPVVFDDLRETGIRGDLDDALGDAQVAALLGRHAVGRDLLAEHSQVPSSDLAALDQTVQERVEVALNNWLARHSSLWELRPQARGSIFNNLYRLRNSVFGITAQSQRRMISGHAERNLAAVDAMLAEASAAGVETIVYVVPLRNDVEAPFVPSEYASFKQKLAEMSRRHGAKFLNLEGLVPAPLWGRKRSTDLDAGFELDFMHFQSEGHALLAEALAEQVELVLLGAPS